MGRPHVLMSVMRHEGWHAAQDCMAGTIDNSLIAIIKPEEKFLMMWQEMVRTDICIATRSNSVGEEAMWAGKTEHMTMNALECLCCWSDVE